MFGYRPEVQVQTAIDSGHSNDAGGGGILPGKSAAYLTTGSCFPAAGGCQRSRSKGVMNRSTSVRWNKLSPGGLGLNFCLTSSGVSQPRRRRDLLFPPVEVGKGRRFEYRKR